VLLARAPWRVLLEELRASDMVVVGRGSVWERRGREGEERVRGVD
jgi:hypothetical protein